MIMTGLQVLQIAVGCVAALTPWLVVRVALGVAARHASAVGVPFQAPPAVARLTRATALVAPFVIVAGFVLTPPSLVSCWRANSTRAAGDIDRRRRISADRHPFACGARARR